MNRRQPYKVLALYFTDDEDLKADYRDLMLERYLEFAHDDLWEALGMLRFRLEQAETEESYEECAIINDILNDFGQISK